MEKAIKKVVRSEYFYKDIQKIYLYGVETFGVRAADVFFEEILKQISELSYLFNIYPECRHLKTKTQIYRNIILGSYLIIYRITPKRIEVLRAIHGSQSPKVFKKIRQLKLK
ncbi:MAG TPA: type II toxin-antitoxin system RelE/ParE family toxin [Bacteroidia bacterium]|jgi:toxin ParE1/3/4|nr:type II toxin-antitoxin system RelE/ParE family toxin [Bacteroidia bacterium]